MYSYKEITELAGYTERVVDLLQVLNDLDAGVYQKTLVATADLELMAGKGTFCDSETIRFEHVPIGSFYLTQFLQMAIFWLKIYHLTLIPACIC